jgi:hypothetical protein
MREYGRLAPTFWIRGTGMRLRGSPDVQVVALYLTSAPTANMIGLYYLPISTIAHDTGIPLQGARKALERLIGEGFCLYDFEAETVFVCTMARWQLCVDDENPIRASGPKPDHRHRAVLKLVKGCGSVPMLRAFWETYSAMLALPDPWWSETETDTPPEAGAGAGASTSERAHAQEPHARGLQGASGKQKKVEHPLPADFRLSEASLAYAEAHGRDAKALFEELRVWSDLGNTSKDWDARFHQFVLNAEKRGEHQIRPGHVASRRAAQTALNLAPNPSALSPAEHAENAAALNATLATIGTGGTP